MADLNRFYLLLPSLEEHEQFATAYSKKNDAKLVKAIGALNKIVDGGADYAFLTSRVTQVLLHNASFGLNYLPSLGVSELDCIPVWSSMAHLAMQKTPDQLSAERLCPFRRPSRIVLDVRFGARAGTSRALSTAASSVCRPRLCRTSGSLQRNVKLLAVISKR